MHLNTPYYQCDWEPSGVAKLRDEAQTRCV